MQQGVWWWGCCSSMTGCSSTGRAGTTPWMPWLGSTHQWCCCVWRQQMGTQRLCRVPSGGGKWSGYAAAAIPALALQCVWACVQACTGAAVFHAALAPGSFNNKCRRVIERQSQQQQQQQLGPILGTTAGDRGSCAWLAQLVAD